MARPRRTSKGTKCWLTGSFTASSHLPLSLASLSPLVDASLSERIRVLFLTSVWTERHGSVATAFVVAFAASLAGVIDAPSVAVWVGVAVATTAVLGLGTDRFGGFVVGLVAAAVVIAARRALGPWGPDAFWLSLVQTFALVATGVTSGGAGLVLRGRDGDAASSSLPGPAFRSLGLLEADVAMVRLDEEVERALAHRRPLTLVLVHTEIIDPALDAEARRRAIRAVARIFEGRLRETDVPFAVSADRLGAILPEKTSMAAWEAVGHVMDAITEGRFAARSDVGSRALADAVRLHVGLVELSQRLADANALFDAATAALSRSRTPPDNDALSLRRP